MKHSMNLSMRIWLILATLIVVAILAVLWATSTFWLPRVPWWRRVPPQQDIPGDIEFFYTAKAVVSTINVTLLVFLLLTYIWLGTICNVARPIYVRSIIRTTISQHQILKRCLTSASGNNARSDPRPRNETLSDLIFGLPPWTVLEKNTSIKSYELTEAEARYLGILVLLNFRRRFIVIS